MIGVQRTQSHQSAAAELPGRLPIMSLQIVQQRNLLFQLVESLATHGLLASMGRIRQSAPRSQARMVGVRKKCASCTPAFIQHHTLSSRRCAHRRTVDGSGKRVGSLQCGAACSADSPAAMRSQACCRQCKAEWRRRRQPIGQDGEGLPARLTDSASHPNAFVPVIVGLTEPPSVADDRVVPANRTSPRQEVQAGSPRVDVVFRLWQCDKENHGWREGPPVTVLCQSFDLLAGPSPSRQNQFRTKKEYCFALLAASPSLRTLAGLKRQCVKVVSVERGLPSQSGG